jgi:hypothetical protein
MMEGGVAEETREFVQGRLERRRAELAESVAGLTDGAAIAISVTPQWSALDELRHILAWQEVALRSLEDWAGGREWLPPTDDEDERNAIFQTERTHLGLVETLAGIEACYARFERMLAASDAELAEVGVAPWGPRVTRLRAISGILWHDGEHLRALSEARRLQP